MKYKLTEETIEHNGHTLYRIEALKDFGSVRQGDKGGFVESEENLSQDSNCWINGNAKVFGDAEVYDNAKVFGDAEVYGNAKIYGDAQVFENAKVYGNAKIYDYAWVFEHTKTFGDAWVFEHAKTCGDAMIFGNAKVHGYAKVYGDAQIYGNAVVHGHATVIGDAKVVNTDDYMVFQNWWSSARLLTWTRSNNKWSVGCFYGTGEALVAKAYKDSELSGREYKRLVDYVKSILQDEKGGKKND